MVLCGLSVSWDPSFAIWGPFISISARGMKVTGAEGKGKEHHFFREPGHRQQHYFTRVDVCTLASQNPGSLPLVL